MKQSVSDTPAAVPSRYTGIPGTWDEALLPSGLPRRHWRKLSLSMGRMDADELTRCWSAGQQLIKGNGISYNVGSDPQDQERPWPMDPVPLLISNKEWIQIEAAIVQRATVLNLLLSDIYGEQKLLHSGEYPPELLFANPRFLRACHGIVPRGQVHLRSYAADLARGSDGKWRVAADCAQAPAGLGYALENRLVCTRTLPNIFNQHRVRPLAAFFDQRRAALQNLASNSSGEARVVLLSAGPHCDTYFEHSFLAGHWGFPLVEGGDLTVRDDRVFVKTITGLEPVDVIVRWLNDDYCDPLELRSDSLLGVPGLMQAVRRGNVAIDNALGCDLIGSPAHLTLLPALCRALLGEELQLESVPTYWCGRAESHREVFARLEQMMVFPNFTRFGAKPQYPALMSAAQRTALIKAIETAPEDYVAQENLALSSTPMRSESGHADAGRLMLRVFASWDNGRYQVMPGGLPRIFLGSANISPMLAISGSKDAWVLYEENEPSARHAENVTTNHSSGMSLPSRVADNFFWLGRYAERVESNVRLIRALMPALAAEEYPYESTSLVTVVQLLVGLRYLPHDFELSPLHDQLWRVQRLLSEVIYDRARTYGLGWNLRELRRVAWNLKERLSPDTWRVLQQIENDFARNIPQSRAARYAAQMDLLDGSVVTLSAFSGLLMENTTRGYGWRVLEIGRRLERTIQMVSLLRAGIAESPSESIDSHMQQLLRIADSSITYRSRHLTLLRLDLLLDLLLVDSTNPRSIGFQLSALIKHIGKLPNLADRNLETERLHVDELLKRVNTLNVLELCRQDASGHLGDLETLLTQVDSAMAVLSDALTGPYLGHVKDSTLRSSV